ncbi:Methionine ABC transporter substrate-binding protein [Liberibacter crescens BT-1]|uniref:Methionine ABC transporter substrate-binding protein n=1 Tax=Liberibacter crescens (strain BT-1) TaxID=1215343 RepID=L0EWP1_LIBCB|nr:MetQ/NlpA family ABC transporter substrate-binding protein [Liberibacter crescens]AGA65048.1 Methionine ABC transporter substrate-binding protein [Liberibacter crescens BT-1]AMC13046.1 dioxygenase [Liberibacter crescens]
MRHFWLVLFLTSLLYTTTQAKDIKVGVSPGEHAQIMEKVKEIAAKKGLNINIIEFSDYILPNQALANGEIDANSFQHKPYLSNQIADHAYDIVDVAYTINSPMGIYSSKLKTFSQLPDNASIAIPNDPTNGGRALLILAKKGVIKLKDGIGLKATPNDIIENSKKINFIEIDAAQLPRSLKDVDAAAINTNYAIEAGLKPSDAILREDKDGPYSNIIAVRTEDKDKDWVKILIEAYHNDDIKKYILNNFKEGSIIPRW